MKSNEKIPSAQFDYIADIINEREQKSLPTFYSISIEQYDKTTPVAEKESGYENFKQQILKYTSDYNLTSITIFLYSGKSRNVKPFQTFKVLMNKQTPTVVFGGAKETANIEQIESSIPVNRYYDEKFELQMRIMRTEMEKQGLTERLLQITERYEDKLKDQNKYNEEKIKQLEQDILELEQEIRDYEKEIAQNEKNKHNSFGNIALGSISARAIENLAKSNIGTGVLKGLLGKEGYETLQGHLAGIENESENNDTPTAQTARIITEPTNTTDPRQVVLNYIQKIGQSLPDRELRMLYDIIELTEKNSKDLQVLWNVSQQIVQQRKKTSSSNDNSNPGNPNQEDNDDLSKIE